MKNVNWKELIIDHIEKGVLGLAGFITLIGLVTTSWGTYDKQPSEFAAKVEEGERNFQQGIWPETSASEFEAEDPGLMVGRLFDGSRTYPYSTRWVLPLNKRKEKIKEPQLQKLESLVADSGRILMEILPDTESSVMAVVSTDPEGGDALKIDGPVVEGPRIDAPRAGTGGTTAGPAGGSLSETSLDEAYGQGPENPYEGKGAEDGEEDGFPGMAMAAATKVKRGKARGTRFVAVRGVFPVKKQVEQLKTALNLETSVEAYQELVFWDFELERQTAVSGPDPWAGDWEQVDIDYALELLGRTDFDTDPVPARFKDATNTMPLPYRVTGNWDREEPNGRILASHPRIKQVLTAEQRERQEEENAALIEATRKSEEEKSKSRRGFSVVQHDTRNLARTVTQNTDMRNQYMEMMKEMNGGGEDGETGEFNPEGIGGGYPGAGGYGTQGGYGLAKVTEIPELILFRFLDFNVIPGNAYRYRVRMVIQNPNFGRDAAELENISLRERETRKTAWSDPSTPSIVKDQTEFYVAKMDEKERYADVDVHEWNTETGSFVDGRFTKVYPGDRIARWREENTRTEGYKKNTGIETAVLRPYEETYDDETIDFVTANTLVDIGMTKLMRPEDHPELEVQGRAVKLNLNEMVMVNRFGELVQVDSVAQKTRYDRAQALMQKQEQVWAALRNKASQPEQSGGFEGLLDGGDMSEAYGQGPANPYGTGGNSGRGSQRRRSSLKRSRQQMMQMMGEDDEF